MASAASSTSAWNTSAATCGTCSPSSPPTAASWSWRRRWPLPGTVRQGRASGQVHRHQLHGLNGTESVPHQAHALAPYFLQPSSERKDYHGLILRLQAAPDHQRPRPAQEQALRAGHQGQSLRRLGIYRQGPFQDAFHQRNTARHMCE